MPPNTERVTLTVTGLDLSLTGTGLAKVELVLDPTSGLRLSETWRLDTIESKGSATADLHDRWLRLARLSSEACEFAEGSDLVVIEAPAFSRTTGQQHDRSGLWWLTVSRLHAGWPQVVEVLPNLRAKYATGKGNAGKDEVLAAVVRRYPDVLVTNNNEADAVVLASIGVRHLGHPVDQVPAVNLTALHKVRWPERGGNAA